MVFETILADLLNRALGDYVENLDTKQLKIGIWGGDVVLENLVLKQSALADLGIPIKIAFGRLGKLVLKIPWKNLYTAPVIATVEELFLVLSPSQEVIYDPEKEEKALQDSKRKVLLKLEEGKKKELEKASLEKAAQADSFVEKLATQILRNFQVKIQDIHVRYEDRITTPGRPFAFGITLHNLSIQTANSKWEETIITATSEQFYKVLVLEGLSVYWNCDTKLYWSHNVSDADVKACCKAGIYTKQFMPKDFCYMLGPINSNLKLTMVPKPEMLHFEQPKVLVDWNLEELSLGISKSQYQDLIDLLESLDRMSRGIPYRKYRPQLSSYRGHYTEWWRFAFTCVLEEDIRRVKRNWRWLRMRKHRDRCREYATAYALKLTSKKVTEPLLLELADLEKHLDVLNIILVREKVEMEVASQLKQSTEKAVGGWFSGWWSGSKTSNLSATGTDLASKFQKAMTPEEKAKLFRAIDYEENVAVAEYPPNFVELSANFLLTSLTIEIRDDIYDTPRVLYTELKAVRSKFERRPAISGARVTVNMSQLTVFGMEQGASLPKLVASKELKGGVSLFDVDFETAMHDKHTSQRIRISSRPLEIIYDAGTIEKIVDVFKPPTESHALNQLQAGAATRLNNFKKMSAFGLQYAIENHTFIDLEVDLKSSYLLIPFKGCYTSHEDILVVNLGHISMRSIARDPDTPNIRALHKRGTSEEDIMKAMISNSYDKFEIRMLDTQVLLSYAGEDWKRALKMGKVTSLHLLTPTSLTVNLDKCVVNDDPRLPKLRILCRLPNVAITLSDERLMHLLVLLNTLVSPPDEIELRNEQDGGSHHSSITIFSRFEIPLDVLRETNIWKQRSSIEQRMDPLSQAIDLDLTFEMSDLTVAVHKTKSARHKAKSTSPKPNRHNIESPDESNKLLLFQLMKLELNMVQKTYDMSVKVRLGGVSFDVTEKPADIRMLDTPMAAGKETYLFTLVYKKVDKKSPEFYSVHKCVEQYVGVTFTTLNVCLHQEALLVVLEFSQRFQANLNSELAKVCGARAKPKAVVAQAQPALTLIHEEGDRENLLPPKPTKSKLSRKKKMPNDDVLLRFEACLQDLSIRIVTRHKSLTNITIEGCSSEIIMRPAYTKIKAKLKNVFILDLSSDTKHHKIVSIVGNEVLNAHVTLYNERFLKNDADIEVHAHISCVRVVYLAKFVAPLILFFNTFQAAKEKVMSAAAEAATAAKQNIQVAKTVIMKLKISLQAPLFIVPINYMSMNAVVLDFGKLTVDNSQRDIVLADSPEPPVVDDIVIGLEALKISRVKLNAKYEIEHECPILEPVSFVVKICHNLSPWYKFMPDFEIDGELVAVNMTLSQEDVKMFMRVSKENLTLDGLSEDEIKESSQQPAAADQLASKPSQTPSGTSASASSTQVSNPTAPLLVYKMVMENLFINLFTGGIRVLDDSAGKNSKSKMVGLARFAINKLEVFGHITLDNSLQNTLVLRNCSLEDTRGGLSKKRTPFFQKKVIPNDGSTCPQHPPPQKAMLQIGYEQIGNNKTVSLLVCSFDLILSLDYLMKLSVFMTESINTEEVVKTPSHEAVIASHRIGVSRPPRKKAKPKPVAKGPPALGMLTLDIKIEKPDIILLESMDDDNTNCLIFNTELLVKIRLKEDRPVISGSITQLQLLSCCYNPERRKKTTAMILHPCNIFVAGSTPLEQGLHLDVTVSDVRLSVSPNTIELLNSVYQCVYGSVQSTDSSIVPDDYSELWVQTTYSDREFWFLTAEMAEDAMEGLLKRDLSQQMGKSEVCLIEVPSIVITVEAGVGKQTLPMVMLETNLSAKCRNWSHQLEVRTDSGLMMSYYNSRLALWEPLIEPVEAANGKITPWLLRGMIDRDECENSMSEFDLEDETVSALKICLKSEDNLEMTVTKTSLSVFKSLGLAFQSAVSADAKRVVVAQAPYVIKNDTGIPLIVVLKGSLFTHYETEDHGYTEALLNPGSTVNLCLIERPVKAFDVNAVEEQTPKQSLMIAKVEERFIEVVFGADGSGPTLKLPVNRADKRYFNFKRPGTSETYGIVSDVKVENGSTIVTIRGIIQVYNHFSVPIKVLYMTNRGNQVETVGTVKPDSELNLPLDSIYTLTSEIFFSSEGYTLCLQPFVWKTLVNKLSATENIQCDSKDPMNTAPFFLKVVGEMEQVYFEHSNRHTMNSTVYNIHLWPAVVIKNLLPVDLSVCIDGQNTKRRLLPGEWHQVPNAEPYQSKILLEIPHYLDKVWMCTEGVVWEDSMPFSVMSFYSLHGQTKVVLDLGVLTEHKNGTRIMSIYCPFWMLNKTGVSLAYRTSKVRCKETHQWYHIPPVMHIPVAPWQRQRCRLHLLRYRPIPVTKAPMFNTVYQINPETNKPEDSTSTIHHPGDFVGPILFSFKAKSFFGKKKASMKIEDGEWSEKFSLDAAGSSGIVSCRAQSIQYQIGVQIKLTHSTLTKQVTFTPFFVMINNAPYDLEVQESDRPADPWTRVNSGSCAPLWPISNDKEKNLRLRIIGTEQLSAAFSYSSLHTTLLKLDNVYGGVNVDTQITDAAVYVTFTSYSIGLAPALLLNHTLHPIVFWEKGSESRRRTLHAHEMTLFTWDKPTGPREIVWSGGQRSEYLDGLKQDGFGEFVTEQGTNIFWVSFLDGIQRSVLFTSDISIAQQAQSAGDLEPLDQEFQLMIQGVGLSLVNNDINAEILYIGIASSGIAWETCKQNGKRYKQLNSSDTSLVECAFQRYQSDTALSRSSGSGSELRSVSSSSTLIAPQLEVDFEQNIMTKPSKRIIRRSFNTGLWFLMRKSAFQLHVHGKINRLQIDNQMYDCVFPVVLAPVPPPKSVASDNVSRPFAEVSLVRLITEHSPVQQFKYFKFLIQEFHIKIDIGLINALVDVFDSGEVSETDELDNFIQDTKLIKEPLLAHVSLISSQEQKNFYENLHFSPLKIHLSFSLASGGGGQKTKQEAPQFLSVLLQSLGVTLTDVQDVVFKLGYFERRYSFLTQRQLVAEAYNHYVSQSVKQLYVLVLGLDVLGNPYGLVVGFSQGVGALFYEPYQGLIQGPGDFAEGLVLGVRSLFGHTVGGAAGAASRITGAMGKGIAALSFDKEYQRKRREALNQRPSNVQMGLAQSGKGLVMGVVDGVSGVFTKPISGAREDGVTGFFTGMGKGVMGLVTRPTAGVIDFASGSLDAVKRAAEMNEEVTRLRLPRFFYSDGLIRPYSSGHAEGNKILQDLEKGRFIPTDSYIYHVNLEGGKDALMLTDKRVMYITKTDVFGSSLAWSFTWASMKSPPRVEENGIYIPAPVESKSKIRLFSSAENGKLVFIKNKDKRIWIVNKMQELMKSS